MKSITLSTTACSLLTVLSIGLTPACLAVAAAAAGAAGVVYVQGDLEAEFDGSPKDVTAATALALEQLSLPVLSASATDIDGLIESRSARDKSIKIQLEAKGQKTHISIRVGTIGDEEASIQILDAIRENLPRGSDKVPPGE